MSGFKKFMISLKDTWLILGVSLLLLVFIELGFTLGFFIKDSFTTVHKDYRREVADTYGDSTWTNKYFSEFEEARVPRWEPYVYWRRKGYNGNYININDDGIRVVPRKDIAREVKGLKIFMFGGSTLWGTGARDEFTIPALLEELIESKGAVDVEVINFGESGYVSTQEIILLIRQLQKGDIPDLVIFYDGVNDTFSAYQQNIAGIPQNESNRAKEFNFLSKQYMTREGERKIRKKAIKSITSNLSTVRFTRYLRKKIASAEAGSDGDELSDNINDIDAIINGEIDIFQSNIKIVSALAEKYGFKYIFYWQPTIFQKRSLTAYEQKELELRSDAMPFYQRAYGFMREKTPAIQAAYNFINLGEMFSDTKEPMYIDYCHLGEVGNGRVAEKMFQDVYPLIKSMSLPDTGGEAVSTGG